MLSIDQTIHWANPLETPGVPSAKTELWPYEGPHPVVPHMHGGEQPSPFDGSPNQWWTDGDTDVSTEKPPAIKGPGYRTIAADTDGNLVADNAAIYRYPNDQEATTLWFHDHTLGITRINVYAGPAAYYFLRDPATIDDGSGDPDTLPAGEFEVEFVLQDRMFDINGQLLFPDGLPFFMPNVEHPFWNPEFLGDVMTVNGKAWPFLNVKPQRYRLRLLNGSNARVYNIFLSGGGGGKGKAKGNTSGAPFWVIGTDGCLLDEPVETSSLLIGPGERYDVIVDFAGLEGQTLTMLNDAKAPYPYGATADPQTVGQVAQFRVNTDTVNDYTYDPAMDGPLRAPMQRLVVPATGTLGPDAGTVARYRQLTLNETPGAFGPLDALLNNTRWAGLRDDFTAIAVDNVNGPQGLVQDTGTVAGVTDYVSEMPQVGSTEVWEIINLTGDAHPIHLHLVQFQVLNRQNFSVRKYTAEYERSFSGGAAANPNQAIFTPHFGPPMQYNVDQDPDDPLRLVVGGNPLLDPYLTKAIIPPKPYEAGWKDTVIAMPKQVTRIVVRYTAQDGSAYTDGDNGFDPTAVGNPTGGIVGADGTDGFGAGGVGYVWHCHIVDHEDNEMMRPMVLVNNPDNVLD